MDGYLHRLYAESLSEFGTPRFLAASGAWILVRRLPYMACNDGMGCYPLFLCQDWSRLHEDLDELRDLVSLTVVVDPFADYGPEMMRRDFDVVVPFKEHYVADLAKPVDAIVSTGHRRHATKALRQVRIERCPDPPAYLDEWVGLYARLCRRHSLRGIKAFSRLAFEKQLRVPGLVMFRAIHEERTIALDLWYVNGDIAYGHLVAVDPAGYELGASYALKWFILHYFSGRVRWLHLGGRAGLGSQPNGLDHFKRGWSTGTRTAYLCGRVFDRHAYEQAAKVSGDEQTTHFPAYRSNEFDFASKAGLVAAANLEQQ